MTLRPTIFLSGVSSLAAIPSWRAHWPESAQEDLDEAWEIAERGRTRLHMADIHLYRARLFFREAEYPWKSPEADLKGRGETHQRVWLSPPRRRTRGC